MALPSFHLFTCKTSSQNSTWTHICTSKSLLHQNFIAFGLWGRKLGVRELDVAPARVPIQLNYQVDQKSPMSAFSPTSQALLPENIQEKVDGSSKRGKAIHHVVRLPLVPQLADGI